MKINFLNINELDRFISWLESNSYEVRQVDTKINIFGDGFITHTLDLSVSNKFIEIPKNLLSIFNEFNQSNWGVSL